MWNADRYGRQAVWLLDSLGDATEAVSLAALTTPEYTEFMKLGNGWRHIWASVVHGETGFRGVDRRAWKRWRVEAVERIAPEGPA